MSHARAPRWAPAPMFALAFVLAAAAPTPVRADDAPGAVLGLLSPARTIGRAEAGVAAFWDPDDAANPALAAFGPEVEVERSNMIVQPGVPDSPEFASGRCASTYRGIGIGFTGWPTPLPGGNELDRPEPSPELASDSTHAASPAPHSHEYADGITLGVSLPALARLLRGQTPLDEPPAFDVALGWAYHSLEAAPRDGSRTRVGGTWDAGAFARWTLVDTRRASREHQSVRLDAAAGLAVANLNRLAFSWPPDTGASVTTPRVARAGGALSLAMRPCPCAVGAHRTLAWLRGADQAIARVSITAETRRDVDDGRRRSWQVGIEATLGRVLTLRAGRVHDDGAQFEYNPTGVGIGIPFGRFGTLRWDQAHAAWARGARQRRITSVRIDLTPSTFRRPAGS